MPRVLSEEHKKKMLEGRRRAAAKKAEGAEERVRAFEEWSKAEAAHFYKTRMGFDAGPRPAKLPDDMWPTQADFHTVYGEDVTNDF